MSRDAKTAADSFHKRAFNIDKHLSRFFDDTTAFRNLQHQSGTVVSGSSALQFIDRTFYPTSDLYLYCHGVHALELCTWLMEAEHYSFRPSRYLPTLSFEDTIAHIGGTVPPPRGVDDSDTDNSDTDEETEFNEYDTRSLRDVYSFVRQTSEGETLLVQVLVAKYCPLHAIISFHSSKHHYYDKQHLTDTNIIQHVS